MSTGSDVLAGAMMFLAEAAPDGNIGTNSETFKPIFQGGLVIMFSGVISAFFISILIDKFNLYERLAEEIDGKYEADQIEAKSVVAREKMEAMKAKAIVTEGQEPSLKDITDEYDD